MRQYIDGEDAGKKTVAFTPQKAVWNLYETPHHEPSPFDAKYPTVAESKPVDPALNAYRSNLMSHWADDVKNAPKESTGNSMVASLGFTPEQLKDPHVRLAPAQKLALMKQLNVRPEEFGTTFDKMFADKSPEQIATALDHLKVHDPSQGPEPEIKYAQGEDAKAVDKKLAPEGERTVNGKVVYRSDGRLMGTDDIAEKVNDWSEKGYNLNERIFAGYGLYLDKLDEQEKALQQRYDAEVNNRGSFFGLFGSRDDDLGLSLGQQLKDLRAAKAGTGYHALTAEEEILNGYITGGTKYASSTKPDIPDAVGKNSDGRPNKPPDDHMVMFTSGFNSSLDDASRDAYAQAYKMGYPLDKIYVFNYHSNKPILLSEVMNEKGNLIKKEKDAQGNTVETEVSGLGPRVEPNYGPSQFTAIPAVSDQYWTKQDNLDSNFDDKIASLRAQLQAIQGLHKDEPAAKINLIGNSQGGELTAGFLLQKGKDGAPLLDLTLDNFIGNVGLTVPASGGSWFAQAGADSSVAQGLSASGISPAASASTTKQLAITSDFTQRNYAALEDPAVRERLSHHNITEVYAAADQTTTSVPLLSLAGPEKTFMVDGVHDDVHDRAMSYLYNSFYEVAHPEAAPLGANLESDKLKYKGYLDKGYGKAEVLGQKDFATGKAGVIDPDVRNGYYSAIGRSDQVPVPKYWPVRENPFFATPAEPTAQKSTGE